LSILLAVVGLAMALFGGVLLVFAILGVIGTWGA
jgi:hypothetical protein